ncbi:MAG: putative sugar kinase YdjH [Bacteroidetes bacterium ADurb.Bin174]|nr:MAG: putative sugar kinase YdjH [Bacteroidetes bacterium ADurb.Bin174]
MKRKIIVSGTGCSLVDRLYNNVSFSSESFSKYSSKRRGDGGLSPGHLVLMEEFEEFSKKDFHTVLKELTSGNSPDTVNIGGPCIVALIHVAQMLKDEQGTVRFYGCYGNDENGKFLLSALNNKSLDITNYNQIGHLTPSTDVLSDPDYNNGHGERTFINSIGSAWEYMPDYLDDDFFSSDIVVFGGTALVPQIHNHLTELLQKSKSKGCITVVNTVFDFINEKANPANKWPLGKSDDSYKNIDLLITDFDEALRLSGKNNLEDAMLFFIEKETGAVIITNGSENIWMYAGNQLFGDVRVTKLPVSQAVSQDIRSGRFEGDTTGCGDNFVGGVVSSLVWQLQQDKENIDLREACIMGIVSGGFACLYLGGTYFEKYKGEKYAHILPYLEKYREQINE